MFALYYKILISFTHMILLIRNIVPKERGKGENNVLSKP